MKYLAMALTLTILLTGCKTMNEEKEAATQAGINRAVAVLHPTSKGTASGVVHFVQSGNQVRITAQLRGLQPNARHGFHIHEYGDCSAPDATSAGGHYNPEGHPHAMPDDRPRHAGDLGNVATDAKGQANFEITVSNITISGNRNPVLGRAVIVHAKPDDGGQPTGNAGDRLACGVIGIANPH